MRKGSSLGITVVVTATIALIVLFISLLIAGGALRNVDTSTSECEQNLGVCLVLDSGVCPQGQNLRYTCSSPQQICCSTARLPVNEVEITR